MIFGDLYFNTFWTHGKIVFDPQVDRESVGVPAEGADEIIGDISSGFRLPGLNDSGHYAVRGYRLLPWPGML